MAPWIFFLFVGVLDMGFYAYALIATANAARVAVIQTSATSGSATNTTMACAAVLQELRMLPNAAGLSSCGGSSVSSSQPVGVTAALVDHGGGDLASRVTVTYLTVPMIPIPGVLPGQLTITRAAELRIGN